MENLFGVLNNMAALIPNLTTSASFISTPCTFGATQNNTTMAWINIPGITLAGQWRDIVDIDQQVYHQLDNNAIDYGTFGTDNTGPVLIAGQWYHTAMTCVPTSTTS